MQGKGKKGKDKGFTRGPALADLVGPYFMNDLGQARSVQIQIMADQSSGMVPNTNFVSKYVENRWFGINLDPMNPTCCPDPFRPILKQNMRSIF